jgi:uncharacterized protein
MPNVVSNTTPLISLLKISRLELLKNLYSEIKIPQAVFVEIEKGRNKKYYQDLSTVNWIQILKIQDIHSRKYFLDLDKGEAEAIILASEINADTIIMDEKLGRMHARNAGLKVTGTIGILIKAKKTGLIKKVKPLLKELKEKEIWISDTLINEVCKIVDE